MITFSWDTFIIVLVLVIVAFIIGLNIVSVIDNKLGNIEVNIPKPNLIVNIKKNTGDIETFVEDSGCKMVTQNKEHFESDTKDAKNDIKIEGPSKKIKINKKTDKEIKNLENPAEEDIVDYGNYICYKKPEQVLKDNKIKEKDSSECAVKMRKIKKFGTETQNLPNNTCGQISDSEDPTDFYKRFKPIQAYMNDPVLQSYNISKYNSQTDINNIGNINLKKDSNRPKPIEE